MNGADTVWVLMATGLVFLMLPGVALLEAGFVRAKNALDIMIKVFTVLCVTTMAFTVAAIRTLGFVARLRPVPGDETAGQDILEHGEQAYGWRLE